MGGNFSLAASSYGGSVTVACEPANSGVGNLNEEGTVSDQNQVVLIPVDDSTHAEAAFEWYVKYVHKPSNYVHILHCPEGPRHPSHIRGHRVNYDEWHRQLEKTKEKAEHLVAKYEEKLRAHQINGDVIAELGRPGEIVVQAAKKCGASMVVMGTRGHGMIRRTILGSVSNYVIHHAHMPVTVVPEETKRWFF